MTAKFELPRNVPGEQRTTSERADTARECSPGAGVDRQAWGALVTDESDIEAPKPQRDAFVHAHPLGAGTLVCFPWEGYYQPDQPPPSPALETFLSNLMFGE